jgi:hypothetical protein
MRKRTPVPTRLIPLLLGLALGGVLFGGENTSKLPRLVFDETQHNFGEVYRGEKVSHKFILKNEGEGTLEVQGVRPSCGCTAAAPSKNNLAPGEQGDIEVTFQSDVFVGKVTKTIVVDTNDPETPHYTLTIEADVKEEVTANPRRLFLEQVRQGQSLKTEIEIKAVTDLDLEVTKINSSSPVLELEKRQRGNTHIIEVSIKKDAPLGRFGGDILVFTNSKRQPVLTIPFFGEIISDISIFPPTISYGTISKGSEAMRQVLITIYQEGVKLTRLEAMPEFLNLREATETGGRFHRLEVIITKDAPAGRLEGSLKIYSTSKAQPIINVPVYAVVK